MWLTALGFLKRNKGSIGTIFGMLTVFLTITQLYDWAYGRGVDDTIAKFQTKQVELLRQQKGEIEKAFNQRLTEQVALHQVELNRLKTEKVIQTRVEKVIEYVDRKIEVPATCNRMSNNVISVLRQATNIFDEPGRVQTGDSGSNNSIGAP